VRGKNRLVPVKVTPHAKRVQVKLDGDILRVSVVVAAENGKANRAVEEAVSKALGLKRRDVRVALGAKSRRKHLEIDGIDMAEIKMRLDP